MSAKKKKKKRPTFVAENGNVQTPIYTIKRGRLDKEVKVLAAGVKRTQFLSLEEHSRLPTECNKSIFLVTALPRPAA